MNRSPRTSFICFISPTMLSLLSETGLLSWAVHPSGLGRHTGGLVCDQLPASVPPCIYFGDSNREHILFSFRCHVDVTSCCDHRRTLQHTYIQFGILNGLVHAFTRLQI